MKIEEKVAEPSELVKKPGPHCSVPTELLNDLELNSVRDPNILDEQHNTSKSKEQSSLLK